MHGIGNRILENIGENSRTGGGQQAQAAFDFPQLVVGVNEVHRPFVVVLVALLSVNHLNIPSQPIAKDASPQSKHLIQQIGMFMRVVLLDYDDHIAPI